VIDVVALAAVRATAGPRSRAAAKNCPRSWGLARVRRDGQCEAFDGNTEVATFRATCPPIRKGCSRRSAFRGLSSASAEKSDFRFLRFPAALARTRRPSDARAASHPP
jgi:hypothetical protein